MLDGAVVSGAGALSVIVKSSIVTDPLCPVSPRPTDRLVAPAGMAGVDQITCFHVDDAVC